MINLTKVFTEDDDKLYMKAKTRSDVVKIGMQRVRPSWIDEVVNSMKFGPKKHLKAVKPAKHNRGDEYEA